MIILLGVVALGVWAGIQVYRREYSGKFGFWDLVLYMAILYCLFWLIDGF